MDNERNRLSYKYQKWLCAVGGSCCALCSHSPSDTEGLILETHHIWSFAKYPKLRYAPNNGIVLCHNCHKWIHHQMRIGKMNEKDVIAIKKKYKANCRDYFVLRLKQLEEWALSYETISP